MASSSSEIEEVRSKVDIVDFVGGYVALKKSGRVFKGCCPFHNEKTPSFQVDPDRGFWYCFGQCGEGGDLFKFLMKIENLTFREALEKLARIGGVTLSLSSREAGQEAGQRDRLLQAAQHASEFYQETLSHSPAAQEYLNRRGIGVEIQRAFRVGYAGTDSSALPRYLSKRGVKPQDAVIAGVLVASENGGFRDKQWERVIFPILDISEQPIAFGGRLMESISGRPKYMNSPESPLFSKSRVLYGLWRARKPIAAAAEVMVVEGYMDVVACHQAGFENVVATLGTALTSEHASILKRYAKRALLAFDSDAAGQKAAKKADDIFKQIDIETRLLAMPEGEDPDSLLRDGDRALMERAIAGALPVTEHLLRLAMKAVDSGSYSENDRLSIFHNEIIPLIKTAASEIEQRRYVSIVASVHPLFSRGAAFAEEQIWKEIGGKGIYPTSRIRQDEPRRGQYAGKYVRWESSAGSETGGFDPVSPPKCASESAEDLIVQALFLGNPDINRAIFENLEPDDFETSGVWSFIEGIKAGIDPNKSLESFRESAPEAHDQVMNIAARSSANLTTLDGSPAEVDLQVVQDCIEALRNLRLRRREEILRDQVLSGNSAAQNELLEVVRQLRGQ